MRYHICTCFLSIIYLCISCAVAKGGYRKGVGTAYSGPGQMNRTGKNACQFNPKKLSKKWNTYYAAMNERDFNKAGRPCGKCVKVKGKTGKTVYAKVVDICPRRYCNSGHVDFSSIALKKITGYSWDKKPIQWKWSACK